MKNVLLYVNLLFFFFFFQAEDGIRDGHVTGVQTCALRSSREDQDGFAVESHRRAVAAQQDGRFAAEIVPVALPVVLKGKKGETTLAADEGPRPDSNLETLARLKPAFKEGGTVTAGNASTINDGAAA